MTDSLSMQLASQPIGAPRRKVLGLERRLTVLAIGPHCDDIELGAGCTLMRLIDEYEADVYYRCLSYARDYQEDQFPRLAEVTRAGYRLGLDMSDLEAGTRQLIQHSLQAYPHADQGLLSLQGLQESQGLVKAGTVQEAKSSGIPHFDVLRFEDTCFPNHWRDIQQALEDLAGQMQEADVPPDLILFPCEDAHQDHVATAQAVNRVFRGGETRWQWEILQFDAGKFNPNLFMDASGETRWVRQVSSTGDGAFLQQNRLGRILARYDARGEAVDGDPPVGGCYLKCGTYAERKADLLTECFASELQRTAPFLEPIRVLGMLAARGMQCGRNIEYAEAFQSRLSIFREET